MTGSKSSGFFLLISPLPFTRGVLARSDFSPRLDDAGRAGLNRLRKNVPARLTTPALDAPQSFSAACEAPPFQTRREKSRLSWSSICLFNRMQNDVRV